MALHITQAPATFSLPVMKKRSVGVFKVRITCISSMQANVPILVRAHCVDEKDILKFEKSGTTWIPPPSPSPTRMAPNNSIDSNTGIVETELSWNSGGDVTQERLMVLAPKEGPASRAAAAAAAPRLPINNVYGVTHPNGSSKTTPTTSSDNASPSPSPLPSSSSSIQQLYEASDDIIFNNMTFNFPSQMKPRWIVFTAELPPGSKGRSVASCLLKVPTIVMSRVTDQLQKAKATLWGGGNDNFTKHSHLLLQHSTTSATATAANTATEIINIRSFRREVRKVLANAQFNRNFLEEEFNFLEAKAGFRYHHYGSNGTGARLATTISADNATIAINWLKANLATCSFFKELYERTNPQIICAVHIQREQTKIFLQDKDPGTFLIRFGSEPGSVVVSVKSSSSLAMWRPSSFVGGVAPRPPSSSSTTGDWIDHIQLPRDVFLRASLEELLIKVADGNARFLLDASSQKVYTRQNVLERSYMQIMPCIVHKAAPLIMNGGAVKATAAGAADGDDADGGYDHDISDGCDDDVVPMIKKQRTMEQNSKFLGGGDGGSRDTKMMVVNSPHEGLPLYISMLNDNQLAIAPNDNLTHQQQEDVDKTSGGASFLLPKPLNGLAAANHFELSRNNNQSPSALPPSMVVPIQLNAGGGGGSSLAALSLLKPCPSIAGEAAMATDMSAMLVAAALGEEGRGVQRREGSMECLHGSLAETPNSSSPDACHPAHPNNNTSSNNNTNPAFVSDKPFSIEAFLAANNMELRDNVHPISDLDMNTMLLNNSQPPEPTTTTNEQQQQVFGLSVTPSSPSLMFDSELMKDECEIDLDFLRNFTD